MCNGNVNEKEMRFFLALEQHFFGLFAIRNRLDEINGIDVMVSHEYFNLPENQERTKRIVWQHERQI